jgi:hypothetical protein
MALAKNLPISIHLLLPLSFSASFHSSRTAPHDARRLVPLPITFHKIMASPNPSDSDEEIQKMSPNAQQLLIGGPPPFTWSSLWSKPVINHLNGKSYTLPILTLSSEVSRNFHLAWRASPPSLRLSS